LLNLKPNVTEDLQACTMEMTLDNVKPLTYGNILVEKSKGIDTYFRAMIDWVIKKLSFLDDLVPKKSNSI
jgi:hypothetical protein